MLKFFGAAALHACNITYSILCSAIALLFEGKLWNSAFDRSCGGSNIANRGKSLMIFCTLSLLYTHTSYPIIIVTALWICPWDLCSAGSHATLKESVTGERQKRGGYGGWICLVVNRRIGGRLLCCFIYTPTFTAS